MKKMVVTILLVIFYFQSWSQKTIPTDGPCTNAMAEKAKGRWIKNPDNLFTTAQQSEVFKRLDAIHQLVLKLYPDPTGVDAVGGGRFLFGIIHIGGGEVDRASAARAVNDFSAHTVAIAQQGRGLGHIAGGHEFANFGGGDRAAFVTQRLDHLRFEARTQVAHKVGRNILAEMGLQE